MSRVKNNTSGDICYEAMQPEQNAKIQQRLYELKALGTLYYSNQDKTYRFGWSKISFANKKDIVY